MILMDTPRPEARWVSPPGVAAPGSAVHHECHISASGDTHSLPTPTDSAGLPAKRDCSSTPEGGDMLRTVVKAASVLLAVVLAVPAWATTAVERTEADMIKESAMIVTGRCTHLQSQWAGKTLVTLATVEVSEVLKGKAGSTVTIALPGGGDANRRIPIAMNYPAAPVILQQEKVLLFLPPQQLVAGSYSVVGYSQGKFTLVEDAQ